MNESTAPGRVLIVAYNFPPIGGIGVQRTLKYATYLPASGWEPVVLTARDPGVRPLDEAGLRKLPEALRVERVLSPEPSKVRRRLGDVVRSVRRLASGRSKAATSAETTGSTAPTDSTAPTASASSVAPASELRPQLDGPVWSRLGGLYRTYVNLAFFPDEQIGWVPFAATRGIALHYEQPFDAVYSSAGPISSHLAAALIARETGLPWVADFRDPWIGNAFAPKLPRWQAYLQRRLERAMIRRADAVTVVTDGMREQLAERYPWDADKLVVIPNGYDRNDFGPEVLAVIAERAKARAEGRESPADGEKFRFVYAGTVYGDRELGIFLDGVERLLARRPELRDRIDVEFIGWLNQHNQAVAADFDTPDRLGGVVRYSSFVPHAEALRRMVGADALFHIIADEPGKGLFLSGKIPEYVGLDRQVVAFMPPGAARDFLHELEWGIVEEPTAEGVARGLELAVETAAPNRPADPDRRYDRSTLARQLAAVLDDVTGR